MVNPMEIQQSHATLTNLARLKLQMEIQQCLATWPLLVKLKPQICDQIERFFVNRNYLVAMTRDRKVYGYGSSSHLAFGETENLNEALREIIELRDKDVTFVQSSINFHVALTQNGHIFAWGKNELGQLGSGTTQDCRKPLLVQIEAKEEIKFSMVRCGQTHSVALTREGQVYCWGGNKQGQCGVGNNENITRPVKVVILEDMVVSQVECGANHSLVLTNRGEVLAWGSNEFGQLGIGKDSNQNVPVRVIITGCVEPVKQIACGQNYSLLMTVEGVVYGFGQNKSGEVGCKSSETVVYQPLIIDCSNRFKWIASFGCQSVALSQNGFCFVWGSMNGTAVRKPRQTDSTSALAALGDSIRDCKLMIQICPKRRSTCPHQESQLRCVSASLANSFNNPDSSDLEFWVQGETIFAHRSILRVTSPYFRRMLSEKWLNQDCIEVSKDSYSYPVYLAYLRYLYTDCAQIEPDYLPELLDLSVSYLEPGLLEHCSQLLISNISLDNCCQFYQLAVRYELAELENFAFKFMAVNQPDVFQTAGFHLITGDQGKELAIKLSARSN